VVHRSRSLTLALATVALLLAWGAKANAQDKTFVSVPGISGESTDANHATWIDAYAFDEGVSKTGQLAAANFQVVSFLKGSDAATPKLQDAVAAATHFASKVIIEVCRAGTSPQQCYYRIELENASIVNEALSGSSCVGSGACTPAQTESVGIKFDKIRWIYTPWTGGAPGTQVIACWDIVRAFPC
jgi:type VI secretion system Hcp family effector